VKKWFTALSIRAKLIAIILTVSVVIVTLIGGTRIIWDVQQARQTLAQELSALTRLLGDRSSAAMVFDDTRLGQENLASLHEIPHVKQACLYRSDNSLLSKYQRDAQNEMATNAPCPPTDQFAHGRSYFEDGRLHVTASVNQGNRSLGWIYLRSDLSSIEARLQDQITFSGIALLVAILFSGLLAEWLQRLISGPIKAVTSIARTIEEQGDHNLRAPVVADDEVGQLALSFNAMLDTLATAREAQQSASKRYRNLVESTSAIPWELDLATWRFIFVGHQAEIVLGYPVENWYEDDFWPSHLHPEDKNQAIHTCASASARGENHQFEYRMIAADGRVVWIHDDVQIIFEDGKPARLHGFMFDISQRKRHEEAITNIASGVSAQTGEAFFPQLVIQLAQLFDADYAFIGLLDEKDSQKINTYAVCAHGKIVPNISYSLQGTPCANVMGSSTCTYPEDVQNQFPEDKLLVQMGANSYIGTPLFDTLGAPLALIVILNNQPMRNLEQAEEILQIFASRASAELERMRAEQTVRKLSLAVEQNPNAILITDTSGVIEYVNPAFSYTTGYSETEAIGATPDILKSGKTPASTYTALWNTIKDGHTWTGELYNRKKNGAFYWDFSTISPITDSSGHITHFLSIQTDVSERKALEEELNVYHNELEDLVKKRTVELESANKELESFSYSVSHDLRAPLRSISGFSQIILEDYNSALDEEGQSLLSRVIDNTQRMSELIDDLLELSRLGRKELNTGTVDFDGLVAETVREIQSDNGQRNITFTCNPLGTVTADQRLLKIVIENLLGNAWKYTSKIEKATIEMGKLEGGDKTVFYVKDNGAGFDMTYVDKIFGAFQRLHNRDEFEGTGIGLATVQRIINRHGGRIWAESNVGKGASFYFTLEG